MIQRQTTTQLFYEGNAYDFHQVTAYVSKGKSNDSMIILNITTFPVNEDNTFEQVTTGQDSPCNSTALASNPDLGGPLGKMS